MRVSVVMTVKDDRLGCAVTLDSLEFQDRAPDEVVVVDGGSTDGTLEDLRKRHACWHHLVVIEAPEANISQGRNFGIQSAKGAIVATIDAGCRAEPRWLDELVKPFEEQGAEFVGGVYRIDPQSRLEEVIGLATMRGQLDPFDIERFNPSARSMAFTKRLWERIGGFPEWLGFSEDTLFDQKVRQSGAVWRIVPTAVVHWRPRRSLRSLARQFWFYGTGRGHTQIGAASFRYNLRNIGISVCLAIASVWKPALTPVLAVALAYFYVYAFHGLALRIAQRTKHMGAYPLTLVVMWTVMFAHLAGYVAGSWQRRRDGGAIRRLHTGYMFRATHSGAPIP